MCWTPFLDVFVPLNGSLKREFFFVLTMLTRRTRNPFSIYENGTEPTVCSSGVINKNKPDTHSSLTAFKDWVSAFTDQKLRRGIIFWLPKWHMRSVWKESQTMNIVISTFSIFCPSETFFSLSFDYGVEEGGEGCLLWRGKARAKQKTYYLVWVSMWWKTKS